jgi:predicted nucleic acid-binding protein
MLIDSDVLIDVFRGSKAAKKAVLAGGDAFASTVTYLELIQGVRSKAETKTLREDLRSLGVKMAPLDVDISHRAILLMEAYRPAHGLELADALIAATALERQWPLVTGNLRRFRYIAGLQVKAVRT